jgi:ADP-ribose pyrophosphatase YjhB (NUDIX family)
VNSKEKKAELPVIDWKNPVPTVDIAVFTVMSEQLHVLLIKRENAPEKGMLAMPGGFINMDKDNDIEQAAARTLKEKTNVKAFLEQVGSVGGKNRDPRGWLLTILYFALVKSTDTDLFAGRNTAEISWVPVAEARLHTLAFDHNILLDNALQRLKNKVEYTALPLRLMPEKFTLGEAQAVYEMIMEKPLEKKSFRRRMEAANILIETGDLKHAGARPAKLYELTPEFNGYNFPRILEGKGSR